MPYSSLLPNIPSIQCQFFQFYFSKYLLRIPLYPKSYSPLLPLYPSLQQITPSSYFLFFDFQFIILRLFLVLRLCTPIILNGALSLFFFSSILVQPRVSTKALTSNFIFSFKEIKREIFLTKQKIQINFFFEHSNDRRKNLLYP